MIVTRLLIIIAEHELNSVVTLARWDFTPPTQPGSGNSAGFLLEFELKTKVSCELYRRAKVHESAVTCAQMSLMT